MDLPAQYDIATERSMSPLVNSGAPIGSRDEALRVFSVCVTAPERTVGPRIVQ